jgi:hypothetical protein
MQNKANWTILDSFEMKLIANRFTPTSYEMKWRSMFASRTIQRLQLLTDIMTLWNPTRTT